VVSIRGSPQLELGVAEPAGGAVFIDTGSDCCAHGATRKRGVAAPCPTTRGERRAPRNVRPLVDVFAP
jgi:hypothetical protein